MKDFFEGKKILITGGTGSLGKEIVKEVLKYNPRIVRIFDSSEDKQFEFKQEIGNLENVRFFLGDVRDYDRLSRAMEDIDIVFHAAALKHVVVCEYNPFEALKTNVLGTQNVVDASMEEDVEKVILTSSDKAVNPSNTMGATKLLAEKLIISANYYRGPKHITKYSCVRFGNILDSSGSVLPLFKKQIEKGGYVTLTHKKMTRFILTQRQALDFLFKSTIIAKGGEVFVPKMSVMKITDLVDLLLETYATKCNRSGEEIEIKQIGIKSGEKLYEELMTEEESSRCVETDDIYIILPQIKELTHMDASSYNNSKKMSPVKLISRDIKPLKNEEIKKILKDEGLI